MQMTADTLKTVKDLVIPGTNKSIAAFVKPKFSARFRDVPKSVKDRIIKAGFLDLLDKVPDKNSLDRVVLESPPASMTGKGVLRKATLEAVSRVLTTGARFEITDSDAEAQKFASLADEFGFDVKGQNTLMSLVETASIDPAKLTITQLITLLPELRSSKYKRLLNENPDRPDAPKMRRYLEDDTQTVVLEMIKR